MDDEIKIGDKFNTPLCGPAMVIGIYMLMEVHPNYELQQRLYKIVDAEGIIFPVDIDELQDKID